MSVAQINSTLFGPTSIDKTLAGRMSSNLSTTSSSLILKSLDPNINNFPNNVTPSVESLSSPLESLNLIEEMDYDVKSVPLLDDQEHLLIKSEATFLKALSIPPNRKVKVVSIFGNTGEGKSFTLNHVFFDGERVFRTSASQRSCTIGVWAMYDPKLNVICLDTEGLLGVSKKESQRTRLLLKVLAVSDIVIYRTRAERLQRDMYTFLGGASKAYTQHFTPALRHVFAKAHNPNEFSSAALGPGLIVFHETRHTDILSDDLREAPEDILRNNFQALNLTFDAFSFIKYVGVKTDGMANTCFDSLKFALKKELESTEVRSARDPKYIYLTLKSLNDKYQSPISDSAPELYLPAFFTCPERCQSCNNACILSMGHKDDGEPHVSDRNCRFQHQYQNCVYLCKKCRLNGKTIVVKPSYQSMTENSWSSYLNYVWSGYIIECPTCGEIYRSRQHWYGNKSPEEGAVAVEIVHIWPGDKHYLQERALFGSQNAAQKVIDGMTIITDAVASVGSQPTKVVTDWMADQIRPSYWKPNHEIKECFKCKTPFDINAKKHHCRACGEGFCEKCSSKKQPVPARGWTTEVRVCDDCYLEEPPSLSQSVTDPEIRARQIGETVVSSISVVKSVLDIPKDFIKDSVRPSYWTPDAECINCAVCERPFGPLLPLHHCRECGKGVCNDCSSSCKPVPLRGWDNPVRVCDHCLG